MTISPVTHPMWTSHDFLTNSSCFALNPGWELLLCHRARALFLFVYVGSGLVLSADGPFLSLPPVLLAVFLFFPDEEGSKNRTKVSQAHLLFLIRMCDHLFLKAIAFSSISPCPCSVLAELGFCLSS